VKIPTYFVHSVEAGTQPDGKPMAYVTLCCTVEEGRAAGALLYRDVTLQPVPEGDEDWSENPVAAAMPGSVVYDLDDPADLLRFYELVRRRGNGSVATLLENPRFWDRDPPRTLGEFTRRIGRLVKASTRTAIREALVEAGLPDLEA
jgi:hypothetical protein